MRPGFSGGGGLLDVHTEELQIYFLNLPYSGLHYKQYPAAFVLQSQYKLLSVLITI